MDRKFEIKKDKIKVGDRLYFVEDNSTYKFNSFRVIDGTVEYIYSDDNEDKVRVYLKLSNNTADAYVVLDWEEYYGIALFKSKKEANDKMAQMKQDATSTNDDKSNKSGESANETSSAADSKGGEQNA